MKFQATEFEFRNRFWLIGLMYGLTFASYRFDKTPVAVAAAQAILSWGHPNTVVNQDASAFGSSVRVIFAFGTLLLILAALLRSWATSFLHSAVVHDSHLHSEKLVAEGPYRYVRNPLYVGTMLQAVGIGFLASRLGFAVLLVTGLIIHLRLIRREEAGLLQSQGESYRRYFEAVPQILPALRARVPGSGAQPNWRDGLAGEMFFWVFAVGMAVFTVTLNANHFFLALGVGFSIYFLQNYLRMGRLT